VKIGLTKVEFVAYIRRTTLSNVAEHKPCNNYKKLIATTL